MICVHFFTYKWHMECIQNLKLDQITLEIKHKSIETVKMKMEMKVKESAVVKPAPAKPRSTIWISNLDAILPENYHTRTHIFYRPTAVPDFFDAAVLKAALARTLSEFYPVAGRLNKDAKGRIEIDCNGEGAAFVEAEVDADLNDLEDFAPHPDFCLTPEVDYSQGISSFPLLLVQVTRFKCGGVCLGVAMDHQVKDGISALHILKTWCDIARGLDIGVLPYLDRRVLAARTPPQPKFNHVEFHPPPALKTHSNVSGTRFSMFPLTRDQLNILKASCQEDHGKTPPYTSFVALTGHVWRCICKARRLPKDQETKLTIIVDGRSRLRLPLPPGYFGNAVFKASHIALSGEVESKPLNFTIGKIREAVSRMDDEYLRSAIDYLEVEGGLHPNARGTGLYKSPNLGITSWARLLFYEVDFGWGRPFYVGLGALPAEGHLIVMPTPVNDGSLALAIVLPEEHMKVFENIFYDI
ncbi:shikimate O-hydroxycinnamoyltransferase-like [Salvia hispanica]|uniref:shikimate O-hydroxycinnamoyltransferase-like n=1 Tax=Salvia hispanica TaxID=49212 RepID=UPI002009C4CE|nr:shikimate O-hydroxycinnamoyltransferase-like [Salvia hispanica]